MTTLIIAFLVSAFVTLLLLRFRDLHLHHTADHDLEGVQKFHDQPVPRIGGAGVLIGLTCAMLVNFTQQLDTDYFGLWLVLAAIPAFAGGLIEDITKRVSVKNRLLATGLSAVLAGVFLNGWLSRIQIPGLDTLLGISLFSMAFTAFAVAGVANAFNIIDGYNGLSSMVTIIILLGMAYVAEQVGDRQIMITALASAAATAGFWVWNYPLGLIFLGDGGAYLIGFLVAELSVLLVARNPSVSPWFPVLLAFYPIFETLFTIFRRVFIHKTNPGLPDAFHLHQLVYGKVVCWAMGDDSSEKPDNKTKHNSRTSPFLWMTASLAVIPAMLFYQDTQLLQIFALLFALMYVFFYRILMMQMR